MPELWTIDELSAQVAAALAVEDYAGPPSGRVRDVPDARTIRWYSTIGLVDRPVAARGRTALYDRRHLVQLVAVKRLQAAGRSLASIQQELAGATPGTLERLAGLAADTLAGAPLAAPVPARDRFWTATSPAAPPPDGPADPLGTGNEPNRPAGPPGTHRVMFAAREASPPPMPQSAGPASTSASAPVPAPPPAATPAPAVPEDPDDAVADHRMVSGLRLGSGVTLLLDVGGRALRADDLPDICDAARPLLDVLRRLGLAGSTSGEDSR